MDGCTTVYHLAALIGIPYSYVSPQAYIQVNVGGTYNVLQSARDVGCEQVLVTSTSETYGTAQTHAISELHPHVAQSPYAATKIGADQLALSYHRSFGLPVKIVRPFNTFGPRQSARAIIPATIAQILSGNRCIRAGNLAPTRDFTYVLDTVEGFVRIANSDRLVGEVTNIGCNQEISVGDLATLIAALMGKEVELEVTPERVRDPKSEVLRLRCDNQKLVDHTAWQPQHSLKDGLIETIEWVRNNAALYKPSLYNV
jgi:dTDP-glucose 4,6-dehydratase